MMNNTMIIEEAELKEMLEELFERQVEVEIVEYPKMNEGTIKAFSLKPVGKNYSMKIHYDIIERLLTEGNVDKVSDWVEQIAEVLRQGPDGAAIQVIRDYNKAKENLVMCVCSIETNKELLLNVPHKTMEDLALYCKVEADTSYGGLDGQSAFTTVTWGLLHHWGIEEEELFNDAQKRNNTLSMCTMASVLKEEGCPDDVLQLMGYDTNDVDNVEKEYMFVVTNKCKLYGANALFNNALLKACAENLKDNIIIIPSSIHEVILLRESMVSSFEEVKEMVESVNSNEVAPCDKLTDSVYRFDATEGTLSRVA